MFTYLSCDIVLHVKISELAIQLVLRRRSTRQNLKTSYPTCTKATRAKYISSKANQNANKKQEKTEEKKKKKEKKSENLRMLLFVLLSSVASAVFSLQQLWFVDTVL